ncbi:MAG: sensor histidine kinase, partial [Rhodothermales bacterium]
MRHRGLTGSRWKTFGVLVGCWLTLGLVQVGMKSFVHWVDGEVYTASEAAWVIGAWATWIPITLPVMWLARHFPFNRQRWFFSVPVHAVAAVVASLFSSGLFYTVQDVGAWMLGIEFDLAKEMREAFTAYVSFDLNTYVGIMAVTYALDYSRRAREREVQASRLKAQLAEARLHALKMQLHPHFLFNTFNTIAMLVRQGHSEEAVEMIAGLGTLLRYVLEHANEQEVPLAEELEFLQSYLDIEQIRFGQGLDVRLDIAPEVLEAQVPSLLLQPLVENAIRHGIEPSGRKGCLEVSARREGDRLHIQMRDSGAGLSSDWET